MLAFALLPLSASEPAATKRPSKVNPMAGNPFTKGAAAAASNKAGIYSQCNSLSWAPPDWDAVMACARPSRGMPGWHAALAALNSARGDATMPEARDLQPQG